MYVYLPLYVEKTCMFTSTFIFPKLKCASPPTVKLADEKPSSYPLRSIWFGDWLEGLSDMTRSERIAVLPKGF